MIPSVTFTRDPLQLLKVDAIGYGAKDTGEMGGGAAAAVLAATGPELLAALNAKLTGTTRRVADVIVTASGRLEAQGICWIMHIISIIKHTPQGAYCPQPERLRDVALDALSRCPRRATRDMNRIKPLLLIVAVVIAALVAARYVRHQRDRAQALPLIAQMGGSVGSIPCEPFGTEYAVSFSRRTLSRAELDRLTVAIAPLASRNPVMLMLKEDTLASIDTTELQQQLPTVKIVPLH